ncbi:GIY-YIG nuclease family protein [candidate division KSB1 bacterium]|nr:GIY-YIG nuclease family protein [candidate division KSB1 bacterium]
MGHDKYFVYVIELTNQQTYRGHTNNLERRIEEHKTGKSPYTRKFKYKKLLYYETCDTRAEAMKREKFLKSGKGREWLRQKLAEQSA